MEAVRNPYAPGAGANPPELAGRDAILREAEIALERHRLGRPNQSIILSGLRGTGKTVLLNRLEERALEMGVTVVSIEASDIRPLPVILVPQLRAALIEISRREAAKSLALRGLRVLASFVSAWKFRYEDISLELDVDPLPGQADNRDLESDVQTLLKHVATAARASGSVVALFVDELQYLPRAEAAAVLTSIHAATQKDLPLILIGAGLPQVGGMLADVRTYAERMFIFFDLGPLEAEDAACALVKPAAEEGVEFEDGALEAILERTGRYPYFLQQWGKQAWLAAAESPISIDDVEAASGAALEDLDRGFFRVRLDRVGPEDERYLRAMAELGPGPCAASAVAEALGRAAEDVEAHRERLIEQGVIWTPRLGLVQFTAPLFDGYLKRTEPGFR